MCWRMTGQEDRALGPRCACIDQFGNFVNCDVEKQKGMVKDNYWKKLKKKVVACPRTEMVGLI